MLTVSQVVPLAPLADQEVHELLLPLSPPPPLEPSRRSRSWRRRSGSWRSEGEVPLPCNAVGGCGVLRIAANFLEQ